MGASLRLLDGGASPGVLEDAPFPRVEVLQVDLGEGLRTLARFAGGPGDDRTGVVAVRLHAAPLGLVALDLGAPCPERAWPAAVAAVLRTAIAEHCVRDALAVPTNSALWNGARAIDPPCGAARRRALAAARPVSVIVATRERPRQLAACLESLLALDYPDFEVVVVDNAPLGEQTRELVTGRFGPSGRVVYVREDERGLGAAHNAGLAVARGEIVAFTDDDVVVDAYWLAELVAPLIADARVGGATGLILPAELETPAQVMLEANGRFAKGFSDRVVDLAQRRPAERLFPFTMGRLGSGANMAFDARYLRSVGGFDPALGTGTAARGGDDLEALFRLVATGRALAYRPGAIVWHHHHRELEAVERQAYGYGVGLGAYLTAVCLGAPRTACALAVRLPAAAWYTLRATGAAAAASSDLALALGGTPPWPRQLTRLQWRGLVSGPLAYRRSRREHRDYLATSRSGAA